MNMDILFVDDDHVTLFLNKELTKRVLATSTVYTKTTVDSALDLLRNNPHKIFLIFLDIEMPVKSGLDFLKEFATLHNRSSVCVLSSSLDEEHRRIAFSFTSVKEFFSKPLSKEKLLKVAI